MLDLEALLIAMMDMYFISSVHSRGNSLMIRSYRKGLNSYVYHSIRFILYWYR